MKVEIDLRTWNRGFRLGPVSALLNEDGRCCLGFLGRALGGRDSEMNHRPLPKDTPQILWPRELSQRSTWAIREGFEYDLDLADAIAKMNDVRNIDDATRRAWIEEGFRHLTAPDGTKCEVVWVGEDGSAS